METVLSVEGIGKKYRDVQAIQNIHFDVHAGEIMAILGPNGAGKSTTIRNIMGIIMPDEGSIRFHRSKDGKIPRDKIGYLPEERGLYRNVSIMDILLYLADLKNYPRERARKRALEYLEKFDLAGKDKSPIEQLSKGMAQKVQFIASVIHEPDFVVLDEPFSGLDPVNQDVFREEIHRLAERGAAVLLSSHQMNLVEETCDRIFLINNGRRVLYGTLLDIKAEYGLHRVQMLVSDERWQWDAPALVQQVSREGARWTCLLNPGVTPAQFMQSLPQDAPVEEISIARISLHDIFVRMATERAVA